MDHTDPVRRQKIAEFRTDMGITADMSGYDAGIPLLARGVAPFDSNWKPGHPRWEVVCGLIKQDLHQDEAAYIAPMQMALYAIWDNALNRTVPDQSLDQLLRFYRSEVGRHYIVFQKELGKIVVDAVTRLMRLQPMTTAKDNAAESPSPAQLTVRGRVYDLSLSMLIGLHGLDNDPNRGSMTQNLDMIRRFIIQARGTTELDALALNYSRDLNGFAEFTRSPALAKVFEAAQLVKQQWSNAKEPRRLMAVLKEAPRKHAAAWYSAYAPGRAILMPSPQLSVSEYHYTHPVATEIAAFEETTETWSLAFSPDGQYLATYPVKGADIQIWAWRGLNHIAQKLSLPVLNTIRPELRFNPDGRLLAIVHQRWADQSGILRIWNTASGRVVHEINDATGGISSGLAFTPNGQQMIRLVTRSTATPGDEFIVHRTDTWEPIWALRVYPFSPEMVAISPDGRFAALGGIVSNPGVLSHGSILIIDLSTRAIVRRIDAFSAGHNVSHLAWNPDSTHIAAGTFSLDGHGAVKVLDATAGRAVAEETGMDGELSSVDYAGNGKYLIERWNGDAMIVKIWDGAHKALLQTIAVKSNGAMAVSPGGRFLALEDFPRVSVWELK